MAFLNQFFRTSDKKQAISWAFYDFANSAYFILIASFVFPIYFKEQVVGGNLGDFYWGVAVSVSILLGAVASPIIGAMADYDLKRKRKFITFAVLSMMGTASLFFIKPGMLTLGMFVFILTNLFFEIAQTLYDSFLSHISTPEVSGRISGLGWGLGYIGGIAAMMLYKPLYQTGYIPGSEQTYLLTFPLTALFFLLFAVPSFIFIKENSPLKQSYLMIGLIKIGFRNVFRTIKEIKQHQQVAWFLAASYLLNDGLVTLFSFAPIYAKSTLNFSFSEIAVLLLIVQLIGFPVTIILGAISDKKGAKTILLSTIALWCLIILGIALATTKTFFYLVSILIGFVVGSSQAIARSWFSKIVPEDKRCEFFGFNGFASKAAATTGPLIFGFISTVTANQRIAMLCLLPLFLASFVIFYKIKQI